MHNVCVGEAAGYYVDVEVWLILGELICGEIEGLWNDFLGS